jgi:hypothetical protein
MWHDQQLLPPQQTFARPTPRQLVRWSSVVASGSRRRRGRRCWLRHQATLQRQPREPPEPVEQPWAPVGALSTVMPLADCRKDENRNLLDGAVASVNGSLLAMDWPETARRSMWAGRPSRRFHHRLSFRLLKR